MRITVKKLFVVILSLILIVCFSTSVFAVQPRYKYTNSMSIRLNFLGTTGYCSVKIYGSELVTSIDNVSITLTDSNGNSKGSWSNLSCTGDYFTFDDIATNLKHGEEYTLTVDSATVHSGDKSEIITGYTKNTCP